MLEEDKERKRKERSPGLEENASKVAKTGDNPACLLMGQDWTPASQPSPSDGFTTVPISKKSTSLTCPCKGGMRKTVYVRCGKCTRLWHTSCVGLTGATVHFIKKLENWLCPGCFKLSDDMLSVLMKEDDHVEFAQTQIDEVTSIVRREVESIIPRLVSGVADEIKETKITEAVNAAGQAVTKSWLDISKTEQKHLIKEVVMASSETALQQSMQVISSDLTERQKRKRNLMISNIPENSPGASLKEIVCSVLAGECAMEDILYCRRLGKKGARPRIVLAVMRREDDAVYFHNDGRGRRYYLQDYSVVWVNPDLTRNEREAMYQERLAKRSRAEAEPTQPRDTRTDNGVASDGEVSEEATITVIVNGEADANNTAVPDPRATPAAAAPTRPEQHGDGGIPVASNQE